jgi:FKBP-type peptidyl-prolyl cis-trans isomerase
VKRTVLGGLAAALLFAGCDKQAAEPAVEAAQPQSAASLAPDSLESKVSYLIGFNTAGQLENQGVKLDVDAYVAGMREQAAGKESRFTPEQAETVFKEFQEQRVAQARAQRSEAAVRNLEASKAFLDNNKSAQGVVTTDSGLQYKMLTQGSGPKPTTADTVRVHYEGKLIDGTVFDSSIERGTPAEFGVAQVISGWTEALQLMPEGSKWELYIPPELAYGENAPPSIGPNQALIFQVELLKASVGGER